jgi:hypothetical protein
MSLSLCRLRFEDKIRPLREEFPFHNGEQSASASNTREALAIPEKYRRTPDKKGELKAGILALSGKRQAGSGSRHEPLMKFISCQPRTDPNASFQIGVKERSDPFSAVLAAQKFSFRVSQASGVRAFAAKPGTPSDTASQEVAPSPLQLVNSNPHACPSSAVNLPLHYYSRTITRPFFIVALGL